MCASVSSRQTATSASLPTSSDPISSSRPSTRAPPMVAISSASRTVSACGPPLARAKSSAWRDLLEQGAGLVGGRAVHAEPDRDAGVPQVADPGDPGAEPGVRGRAVRDRRCRSRPARRWPRRRGGPRGPYQTSGPSQPSDSMYSTGDAAELLAGRTPPRRASRTRWVCIRTPLRRASSAACLSSVTGDRERRAGRHADPQHRVERRVVVLVDRRVGRGQDGVDVLDHVVRRQAALLWPRSIEPRVGWNRSPTGARALDLRGEHVAAVVREDVVVVGRRGAAGARRARRARRSPR